MHTCKDHGYAWVVLAASCIAHAVHIGFAYGTLGSFTIAHKQQFNITLEQSTWLSSVQVFVMLACSPLSSTMVNKFSCRVTQLFGSVCLMAGVGLGAFSTEIWHAYLLYSTLIGIGTSATYMASSAILVQYFDRHKYLAFAVAVLGMYGGVSFWAILSQSLFDQLGYHKASAVMCAIMSVNVIAGILYYDNAECSSTSSPDPGTMTDSTERKFSDLDAVSGNESSLASIGLLQVVTALLRRAKIWALLVNCLLWQLSMASFLTLVNDYMIHHGGLDKTQAALGVTIVGISNSAGCIVMMLTSQLNFDRLGLHVVSSSVWGIAIIISPFSTGQTFFYVTAAVYGIAQGAQIANLLSVIYDFCGAEQMATLFGIELLAEGIGGLIGAPLCGYLQTEVGSKMGLFISGGTAIVASFCLVPAAVKNVRKRQRAEGDTLKAMVIGTLGNTVQQDVVREVSQAAGPEYPHLHKPHLHLHHHENQAYETDESEVQNEKFKAEPSSDGNSSVPI